jgi:DNA polymerase-3 subunit delta'
VAKKARTKSAESMGREEAQPPARAHPTPCSLSDLLGQDHAVRVMSSAIRSGRVPHAWVFHGPPGVGKFTAALAFAALLLDPEITIPREGPPTTDPDSAVQRLLRSGSHPDLHVVDRVSCRYASDPEVRRLKQTTIPVEVVREFIVEPCTLAPLVTPGGRASKVFVVDDGDLLARSSASQNALLKTLEEPDGRTVLIITVTAPERLLPTIRSRSQMVRFGPLRPDDMRRYVSTLGLDLDRATRDFLTEYAAGSPGEFSAALADGLYAWHERLSPGVMKSLKGKYVPSLGVEIAAVVEEAVKAWEDADKQASKEALTRQAARRAFKLIAQLCARELRDGLPRRVDSGSADGAVRAIESIARAERMLDSNVQMLFVAEWLSGELASAAG